MKSYIVLLSAIIPALSFAMEQEIETRNRSLDTLQKPYITIINRLPQNADFCTRIDIADKTKINTYTKDSYKSDDSTKTIWPGNGIRFSPYLNRTGAPEYKRLGMNDTQNAALIALYIHGIKHPLKHLFIGEGSQIQFGDSITITTKDDTIIINLPNNESLDIYASLKPSAENNVLKLSSGEQVVYLANTFLEDQIINHKYTSNLLNEWDIAKKGWENFFNYIPELDEDSENTSYGCDESSSSSK